MEILSAIPAGGTLFNAAAIVAGGAVGLAAGRFIPEKTYKLIFQSLGLFILYLGFSMALKTQGMLTVMFAMLAGAVTGEMLDADSMFARLGDALQRDGKQNAGFTHAFMTSSILFCVGSMAVLGAVENGLTGNPRLLVVKGCIDGATSVLFAASMGTGVLFSALPLLVYQGTLTFASQWLNEFITPMMMDNLSGLGGLILVAVGLNMLKLTDIKTANLLPGVGFVLIFSALV